MTHAKVSASIVKVGNKVIDPYDINDRFTSATTAGFPYSGGGSYTQSNSITDASLNPEFTLSKEFNLNLEFFKRRITFDASYYYADNTDQILETSPSYASGALAATVNVGKTKSQGLELDLGITPFKTDDFSWDLRLSYSAPKTEVVKVTDNAEQVSIGNSAGVNGTAVVAAIVGQEFPMLVGTGYLRDDQGRIVIDELNGDPIKATNVNLGKTTPDYILGLSTSVNYKGFRLTGVFDYRTGHVFYAPIVDGLIQNGSDIVTAENGRQPFIMPNSVISNGAGGYVPNNNVATSGGQDYYTGIYREIDENMVFDATAFKCRELALSYSFNEKALKNTFLSSLSIGLNARNVFMILPKENRNYTDPEFTELTAGSAGRGNNVGLSSANIAPPTRSYGFNINITF
ncbi:TonB dependent receptor [compost metagenome]